MALSLRQPGEARQIDVSLNVGHAATDIASAVLARLLLNRHEVTDVPAYFSKLYRGAYQIVQRVASGKTTSGQVPLPIFQALACLRPRKVYLNGMDALYVRCVFNSVDEGTRPTGDKTDDDVSEFLQACRMLNANCDLDGIKVDEMRLGSLGNVPLCHTMGPLTSLSPSDNKTCQYLKLREDAKVGTAWMSYLGWANAFTGVIPDYTADFPLFPLEANPHQYPIVTPGTVILARALKNLRVLTCKVFSFPMLLPKMFESFLASDAKARGIDLTPIGGNAYKAAFGGSLCVARAGLENGMLDYHRGFLQQKSFMLPASICESSVVDVYIENSDCMIPVPYDIHFMTGSATTAPTTPKYSSGQSFDSQGYCMFVMGLGSVNLKETTSFHNISGVAYVPKMNFPTFIARAWGTALPDNACTDKVAGGGIFANTIGRGPLARPGSDNHVGRFNFTNISVDLAHDAATDSLKYTSINCKKQMKLSDQSLSLLSNFPLMVDAYHPNLANVRTMPFKFADKYFHRLIVDTLNPSEVAVQNTVSEAGSAKHTECQQFINQLQISGEGGDSLLGYISKGLKFAGKVGSGLGIPGSGVISVAGNVAEYFVDDERSQRGRRARAHTEGRRVKTPRPTRKSNGNAGRPPKPSGGQVKAGRGLGRPNQNRGRRR